MTTTDGYGGETYGRGSIVTPEAVVLNFELAGLASRTFAYTIDFIVQFIALIAFAFLVGLIAVGSELVGLIVLLVGLIMIVLGYATIMETFNGGRTLGRMVVKTRVVTVEGAPVRFRQAFIRALLGIVDLLISVGMVAVVSSLITRRGQRLGDLVAGTMVVREPANKGLAGAVHFWPPNYLADWSQTVDTRALGHDAYQLVRDFLTRSDLVEPQRSLLAEDVALLVSERLPHAARPLTVPAMDYLMAIATATQDRAAPMPQTQSPPRGFVPGPPSYGATPYSAMPAPGSRPAAALPPPPGVVPRAPYPAQTAPPQSAQLPPPVQQPAPTQPAHPAQPVEVAETVAAPNEGGFARPG